MGTLTESSFVQRAGYGVRTLVETDGEYEYELSVTGPDPRSLTTFTFDVQGVEVEDTTTITDSTEPVALDVPDSGVIGTDTNTTEGV